MDTIHKRVRVNFVCTDRRRPPISSAVAQRHWQAQPSQAKEAGHWHRPTGHPQLSPGSSLRMVAAFRPVPPACDSISNRKATFRLSTQLYNQICFAIAARHYPPGHRLPSTRQLAMQTGLHRNTISKVTANWNAMAWWKPWPAPASTCETSKSPGNQDAATHPESRSYRSRQGGAQMC